MTPCNTEAFTEAPVTAACPYCRHTIGSHLYPSGMCLECAADEMNTVTARLTLSISAQERIDQLANAIVFLVQRLERVEQCLSAEEQQ